MSSHACSSFDAVAGISNTCFCRSKAGSGAPAASTVDKKFMPCIPFSHSGVWRYKHGYSLERGFWTVKGPKDKEVSRGRSGLSPSGSACYRACEALLAMSHLSLLAGPPPTHQTARRGCSQSSCHQAVQRCSTPQ